MMFFTWFSTNSSRTERSLQQRQKKPYKMKLWHRSRHSFKLSNCFRSGLSIEIEIEIKLASNWCVISLVRLADYQFDTIESKRWCWTVFFVYRSNGARSRIDIVLLVDMQIVTNGIDPISFADSSIEFRSDNGSMCVFLWLVAIVLSLSLPMHGKTMTMAHVRRSSIARYWSVQSWNQDNMANTLRLLVLFFSFSFSLCDFTHTTSNPSLERVHAHTPHARFRIFDCSLNITAHQMIGCCHNMNAYETTHVYTIHIRWMIHECSFVALEINNSIQSIVIFLLPW